MGIFEHKPATLGTILALAATIVLVFVSVSTPIIKSITFLNIDLSVAVASVSIDGTISLGTFGWCLAGLGTKAVCQGPRVGYDLKTDQLLGNNASFSLPDTLIKWLTYALIVHPIAALLGGLSFLLGCVSHCRAMSTKRWATGFASLATTIALIAFVFDIVLFSIAKSRINDASNSDVGLTASLGKGIWLTLVGFILLFISSISFGIGRRHKAKQPSFEEKQALRPRMDDMYASQARRDAEELEKLERNKRGGSSGLPAFPEEEMPLTALPKTEELYSEEADTSQNIVGVGTGYGRRRSQDYSGRPSRQATLQNVPPQQQASNNYNSNPSQNRAEPFTSMYDAPSRQGTPAQSQYSRTRQGSEPMPAIHPYEQEYRRQQVSEGGHNGHSYHVQALAMPAPMAFPAPDQHRGGNPDQYDTGGYAQQTYPPQSMQNSSYAQQESEQYGYSGNQYESTSQEPYGAIAVYAEEPADLTGGNTFHSAAANSRHRQSRSMGYGVDNYQGQTYAHQQSMSQGYDARQQEPAVTAYQGQEVHQSGSRFGQHLGTNQSPTANALSPRDIYDTYYTASPLNRAAPSTIPYVPDPESTPSPSYHATEPYPTYGGNAYR